ncbi:hypothetical protein UC34_04080 [Pandoraea vervacti]|uniref:Uncharacterized protein n=1 Tax=Pandoraea vervacti TaxID=656178 RepID=A0ABM5SVA8_9BURK|nr:hypothetical protein [Pandoraea vervacti]AJP56396.1 hypothetical protein UC34_04080 [Pandoraea vervacti]
MAILNEFNQQCLGGFDLPDRVFADFLKRFRSMGPLDVVSSHLAGNRKADRLYAAALCHVASIGGGRDYLQRVGKLELADHSALLLLNAMPSGQRAAMLDGATLGTHLQIVLTFPGIDLRMALGASCFGDGQGALTPAQTRRWFLQCNEEDGGRARQGGRISVAEKFVSETGSEIGSEIDSEVGEAARSPDLQSWRTWCALTQRCIDARPVADVRGQPRVMETLGHVWHALARTAPQSLTDATSISELLWKSAAAFANVDDLKTYGRVKAEAEKFDKQAVKNRANATRRTWRPADELTAIRFRSRYAAVPLESHRDSGSGNAGSASLNAKTL